MSCPEHILELRKIKMFDALARGLGSIHLIIDKQMNAVYKVSPTSLLELLEHAELQNPVDWHEDQ